jgi:hypothetical protein
LTQRQPDWDAGRYAGDWSFVADARFAYTCSPAVPEKECTLVDMLEDPEWSGDRRAQHPEVLRRLQQVVSTLPAYGRSKATDVDPDTRDRLRSLGYVN